MILRFNDNDDSVVYLNKNSYSNSELQELFHKYYETTKKIGNNISNIDKLICKNISDRDYFRTFKTLFSTSFTEDDLVSYFTHIKDKKYVGISSIKTNTLIKHSKEVTVGNSIFTKIEDANISYRVVYSKEFLDKYSDLLSKADIRNLEPFIESGDIIITGMSYSEVKPGEFPFLVSMDKHKNFPTYDGDKIINELNDTINFGTIDSNFSFIMSQIRSDDVKIKLCEIRNNLREELHSKLCDTSSFLEIRPNQKVKCKVLEKKGD